MLLQRALGGHGRGLLLGRSQSWQGARLLSSARVLVSQPVAPQAPPGAVKKRRLPWPIKAVLGVGIAVALVVGGVGAYGSFKLNRRRTRWFSDKFVLTPESLRMPYRSVYFETEDGVQLEGWYIQQTVKGRPSEKVVLCNSPYNHDKSTLLAVARALWDTGHSVLLYDFRAFGPRPAKQESIGHLELLDGQAAMKWLRANKPEGAKIGIMGCSMGGAVALMLAEEDDSEVVGVATDCAFGCLRDVVHHYIESSFHTRLPGKKFITDIVVHALATCNLFYFGYDLAHVGPMKNLDRLRVPLLILHSDQDSVVPFAQALKIFQGAATPDEYKKLVVAKGCEHIGSFFDNEIAYSRRIVSFLDFCFEEYTKREEIARVSQSMPEDQDRAVSYAVSSLSPQGNFVLTAEKGLDKVDSSAKEMT